MPPVLVCPDKFKGTFRATQVAGAIGRGLERAGLEPPDLCPIADGGDGTLEVLVTALGGETAAAKVRKIRLRPGTNVVGRQASVKAISLSRVSAVSEMAPSAFRSTTWSEPRRSA